jgi:hypothetical protein
MKVEEKVHWGDSISIRNNNPDLDKHEIIEPWKSYFNALGETQECLNLQLEYGEEFFDYAKDRLNAVYPV